MKTLIQKRKATRDSKLPAAQKGFRQHSLVSAPQGVRSLLKLNSILVPVDFSAESEKALAYAVPFARQFGAKLTVLNVVEPTATPDFLSSFPLVMENDELMAETKRHLDRVVSDLAIDPTIVGGTLVRYGRSFHEITEAARSLKSDLII